MAAHLDLILSVIVVGLLTLLIFSVHAFMIETSVDNRLTQEMQDFADVSITVMQEEIRYLNELIELNDHSVRFTNTASDTVDIFTDQNNLKIVYRKSDGSPADTLDYSARISELNFVPETMVGSIPTFLRVRVQTESRPEQQVGGNDKASIRAFAEKQFFLRNLHLNN